MRAGKEKVRHFYHLPGANCPHSRESKEHLAMKQSIIDVYQNKYPLNVEVSVIPGRRTDVLIKTGNKISIAVECQVSPITIEEWEKRTRYYNKKGIYVFWVFHLKKRLKLDKFEFDERRISSEILRAHRYYYGQVYIMDDLGSIKACKFLSASREVDYEAEGIYYSYSLKKTKCTKFYTAYRSFQFFKNGELLLAGLKDDIPRKKKKRTL